MLVKLLRFIIGAGGGVVNPACDSAWHRSSKSRAKAIASKTNAKRVSLDPQRKRKPSPPKPTPAGWATLELSEGSARPSLLIA